MEKRGVSMQVVLHDITGRRQLEQGILDAVESEQRRLGQELHDGLCQLLIAVKYRISLLEQKLVRKLRVRPAEMEVLEKQLNDVIGQTHSLARGLSPVKMVGLGLVSALEKLAASVQTIFGVRCICDFPEPVPVRDHAVAHHLYRIAQECIQNAVKHGKARNIRITFRRVPEGTELVVENDGVGFPRKLPAAGGMGLSNMKARANMIGASLDIRRGKRGGTVVACREQRRAS
jgi:signal transduction histidine kinase